MTTGNFPGSDPDPSDPTEPPAEIAVMPEDTPVADAPATDAPSESGDGPGDVAETPETDTPSETPTDTAEAQPGAGSDAPAGDVADTAETGESTDETATAPEAAMAEARPPLFGNIRFPAAGVAVVAGQAAPGEEVVVLLDGEEVATATANAAGDFAALFDLALSGVPRVVRIATRPESGELVFAEDSRIVEPRQAPVQMAEAEDAPAPDTASTDTSDAPMEMADAGQASAPDQPGAPNSTSTAPVEPAGTDAPGTEAAPTGSATPTEGAAPAPDSAPEATEVAEAEPTEAAPAETPEPTDMATANMGPQTPRVLRADRDGIRVIEELGPADMPDLSLDAIAYDDAGEVTISGRGEGGQQVRLYLDNALVGDATVGPDGQWRLTLPESVEPGIYTMRVDEIGSDGGVTARVESPFKREDPEMLVAALGGSAGTETAETATAETALTPEGADLPGDVNADGAVTVDQPDGSETPVTADTPTEAQAGEAPAAETLAPTSDAPEVSDMAMADAPDAPETGDAVMSDAPTDAQTDAPATDTAPSVQSAGAAPEAPGPEPMISAITVQPGSTLWAISRERYGDGLLYVQVFEANRDKIRDPDLIYPGQVFELPTNVSAQ
ncbi:MAG: LysM peptidoglycan-binding domain-containing protein [Pseudomonadota bacterium]|nr:LysM peptidoglycan-binding domain-containing protein [Pseudomonadota bacterium]